MAKKKSDLKHFAIIGTLLAAIFLSGFFAISYLTIKKTQTQEAQNQTNIDTSNWKTYTNDLYGFSFKYPQNWISNRGGIYGDLLLSFDVLPTPYPNAEFAPYINMGVIKNPNNLSTLDYLTTTEPIYNQADFTNLTIDGFNAVRGPLGGATLNDNVFVSKNGYLYHIRLDHSTRKEVDIPNSTFDQILSTFKFIN